MIKKFNDNSNLNLIINLKKELKINFKSNQTRQCSKTKKTAIPINITKVLFG